MNSKELGIFTAMTNPRAPEQYRITDGGTKLYTIMWGGLVCFEGVSLDKMNATELFAFYQKSLKELQLEMIMWDAKTS